VSTPLAVPFISIHTTRLTLEPVAERHADAMFAVLDDPQLYRYMLSEIPDSLTSLRERYRMLTRGLSPDGSEMWLNWIVVPREDGVPIGYVQATIPTGEASALLGWTIGRHAQGWGLARESVRALCDHLAAAGVTELHATIDSRNARSIGLAEALGFVREATFASDDVLDGVRGTDHSYVLRIQTTAP